MTNVTEHPGGGPGQPGDGDAGVDVPARSADAASGEAASGDASSAPDGGATGAVEPRHAGRRRRGPFVMPSRTDPLARSASQIIGGPAGDHLVVGRRTFGPGGGPVWIVVVLSLLAGGMLGLGLVQKQHCRASGWTTPDQFWHACYSDVPVLYGSAGLGGADAPSLVAALGPKGLGQPPLAGAAMWVVSKLVTDPGSNSGRVFFDLSAIVLAGVLAAAVGCLMLAAGRRPWDAAHLALSPLLLTVGLISYDLLAVALLAGSLLALSRRRELVAGVLLGLAVLARPQPAIVGIVVLALAVRAGRAGAGLRFVASGVVTWVALRIVLLPGSTGGILETYRAWRLAKPGYGSVWLVPQLISSSRPALAQDSFLARVWYSGGGLEGPGTTLGVLLCLVLLTAVVVVLGLSTTHRPRLAHLALFATAGCLLVTKSVPVQAGLVLLPFIALAGLRWRDHLIWAGTEFAYFVGTWMYIAASSDADKGLPAGFYLVLLLTRQAGMVWIMSRALRAMRDPFTDPVRVPPDGLPGEDDPLVASLDGAPDAVVVRIV